MDNLDNLDTFNKFNSLCFFTWTLHGLKNQFWPCWYAKKDGFLKSIEKHMKSFIHPNDSPGTDLGSGKMAKYQRDLPSVVLNQADTRLIVEARAILDEFLNNASNPLHDPKHPRHEQVKKAVLALEEKITLLTCDPGSVERKTRKGTHQKNEIGENENEY